jgi:hypothetical protein
MKKALLVATFSLCFGLFACTTLKPGLVGPDYKVLAVSYVDSTGLYWLAKLDEDSKNGCVDKQDAYHAALCSKQIANESDSDAEKHCKEFGARLPTIEEYGRLLKDFEPSASLEKGLSTETYHQVAMAFKDDIPYAAWTSSVRSDDPTQAHYFSWHRGQIQDRYEYRSVELPVRCVRR